MSFFDEADIVRPQQAPAQPKSSFFDQEDIVQAAPAAPTRAIKLGSRDFNLDDQTQAAEAAKLAAEDKSFDPLSYAHGGGDKQFAREVSWARENLPMTAGRAMGLAGDVVKSTPSLVHDFAAGAGNIAADSYTQATDELPANVKRAETQQASRLQLILQNLGETYHKVFGNDKDEPTQGSSTDSIIAEPVREEQPDTRTPRQRFDEEWDRKLGVFSREQELLKGNVQDDGVMAGAIEAISGSKPSEIFANGKELEAAGAPVDPEAIRTGAVTGDFTNIAPLHVLPPAASRAIAGAGLKVAGKGLQLADELVSAARHSKTGEALVKGAKLGVGAGAGGYGVYQAMKGDPGPMAAAVGTGIAAPLGLFMLKRGLRGGAGLLDRAGSELLDQGFVSNAARNAAEAGMREASVMDGAAESAATRAAKNTLGVADNAAALGRVGRRFLQSTAEGAVGGAAFAGLVADNPEEAAHLIGGAIGLGAVGGTMGAGLEGKSLNRHQEINRAATKMLADRGAAMQITDPGLRQAHENAIQGVDQGALDYLNSLKGLFGGFKNSNGKPLQIALVSKADFEAQVAKMGYAKNAGEDAFAVHNPKTGEILINKDAGYLGSAAHEAGHFFNNGVLDVLKQAYRDGIEGAITRGLFENGRATPEFQAFIDAYNKQTPGKPIDASAKPGEILKNKAVDEYIAETVRGILNGGEVGRFKLPKDVSDRIADSLVDYFGDSIGVQKGTFDRTELPTIAKALNDALFDLRAVERPAGKPQEPEQGAKDAPREPTSPYADIGITQETLDSVRDYHIAPPGMAPKTQRANPRKNIPGRKADDVAAERGQEWDTMLADYAEFLRENGLQAPKDPTELHQAVIEHALTQDAPATRETTPPSTTPRATNEPILADGIPTRPGAAEPAEVTSIKSKEAEEGALSDIGPDGKATLDSPAKAPESPTKPEETKPATTSQEEVEKAVAVAETDARVRESGKKPSKAGEERVKKAKTEALLGVIDRDAGADQGLLRRREENGEVKYTGRIDTSIPSHRILLKEAGIPEGAFPMIDQLSAHAGETVYIDYLSAKNANPEDTTGAQRSEEYQKNSAAARRAGAEGTMQHNKAVHVFGFKAWPSGKITATLLSPDRIVSNAKKLIDHLQSEKIDTGYHGLNDPALIEDVQGYMRNHANHYKGDGSGPVKGAQATPGYEPHQIPRKRFDLLNAALNFDVSTKIDSKLASTRESAAEAQHRALENDWFVSDETGDTNPLRDFINQSGKLVFKNSEGKERIGTGQVLEPVFESLAPDLIKGVRPDPGAQDIVRPAGFTGDPGAVLRDGVPNIKYAEAGFMPKDGALADFMPRDKRDESGKPFYGKQNHEQKDPRTGRGTLITGDRISPEASRQIAQALRDRFSRYNEAAGRASRDGEVEALADAAEAIGRASIEDIGLRWTGRKFEPTEGIEELGAGAESIAYADGNVVYKLFPPRFTPDGEIAIGYRGELQRNEDGSFKDEIQNAPGKAGDVLEKLHVLARIGGIPSEVIGITKGGGVIVKQPRFTESNPEGRELWDAQDAAKLESPEGVGFWNEMVTVVDGQPYLISDLSPSNHGRDTDNRLRITDAIVTRVPQDYIDANPDFAAQIERLRQEESQSDRSEISFMPKPEPEQNYAEPQSRRDNEQGALKDFAPGSNQPRQEARAALERVGPDELQGGQGRDAGIDYRHYSSREGLTELDPTKHGTGLAGAERKRKRDYPELYEDRTYVGFGKYEKEQGLGNQLYRGNIDESLVYDIKKDPLDLYGDAAKWVRNSGDYAPFDRSAIISKFEQLIKQHGFLGYSDPEVGVAAVFHKIPVDKRIDLALFDEMHPNFARRTPEMLKVLRRFAPNFDKIEPGYFEQKKATPEQVSKQNAIAKDYEAAKSDNLKDPNVKHAYESLVEKIQDQWKALEAEGITIEPWATQQPDGSWKRNDGPAYKSSRDLQADLRNNKHLFFDATTTENFGSSQDFSTDHPMFLDSGMKTKNGFPLLNNDILRAVHDAIAHGSFGVQFGPIGEEAAWRAHMATVNDPWARWALTTETRGQNSWVNYRDAMLGADGMPLKKGDKGYIPPQDRPFADQKADLLPPKWMLTGDKTVDALVKGDGDFRRLSGLDEAKAKGDEALADFMPSSRKSNSDESGVLEDRPFYSQLQKVVEQKMPNRASADQVRGMLDPSKGSGIKAEEMEWMGLPEFLAGKDIVAKQELLDFIRSNQVELKEVQKGMGIRKEATQRFKEIANKFSDRGIRLGVGESPSDITTTDEYTRKPVEVPDDLKPLISEARRYSETLHSGKRGEANIPKFEQYRLPGGENYKEVLLTLPENRGGDALSDAESKRYGDLENKATRGERLTSDEKRELSSLEDKMKGRESSNFKGSHWDEPNVLAHIRQADFKDADGNKVRVIEEIQSDWHQKGRREGYKGEIDTAGWSAAEKEGDLASGPIWRVTDSNGRWVSNVLKEKAKTAEEAIRQAAESGYRSPNKNKVPDAPFKKTWHELAFKKALRQAVEDGADKIAWVTGEIAADRFDLSKQVDAIEYDNNNGSFAISATKDGANVFSQTGIPESKLADYVGKEVAQKIINNEGEREPGEPEHSGVIRSDELKVGGEGMKGFYDKIIPDFARKYVKKWGGKVETVEIGGAGRIEGHGSRWTVTLTDGDRQTFSSREGAQEYLSRFDGDKQTLHSITITPEMRESVMTGQPLFMPSSRKSKSVDSGALMELDFGKKFSKEEMAQQAIKRRVSTRKDEYPEALPVVYKKGEDGKFVLDEDGKPKAEPINYDLYETPLAKQAAKGIRGEEKRKEAVASAYGQKLVEEFRRIEARPDIMAGREWYKVARTKIKKHFGDDALLFAQLLGATSARTPVLDNFQQAIDAYNQLKAGAYDGIAEKYLELRPKMEAGELQFRRTWGKSEAGETVTPKTFKDYLDSEGLLPRKSNGSKFNANSYQVLNVIAGVWEQMVGGPKTPNFAGNLAGKTFEATIDVWAARGLRRLGSEGLTDKPWRILPESETGVEDHDFYLGQAAYRKAADELGMNPDDLQGVLWFAEKDTWEKRGWTKGAGAEKSDFNSLLDKTRTENGRKVLELQESKQQTLF